MSAPLGRCKVCLARSHPFTRVTKSATAARARNAGGERPPPRPAGPLRSRLRPSPPHRGVSAAATTPPPSAGLAVTPPRLVRGCTPRVATQGAATPPPPAATGAHEPRLPPRPASRHTNHERRAAVECAEVGTPCSPEIPATPPAVAPCAGRDLQGSVVGNRGWEPRWATGGDRGGGGTGATIQLVPARPWGARAGRVVGRWWWHSEERWRPGVTKIGGWCGCACEARATDPPAAAV